MDFLSFIKKIIFEYGQMQSFPSGSTFFGKQAFQYKQSALGCIPGSPFIFIKSALNTIRVPSRNGCEDYSQIFVISH